jgi:DNA-binding FadR family transcriptional regulator
MCSSRATVRTLERAGEAHRLIEPRHGRGKIVLTID